MTEAEFRALAAQGYNRIPLVLESFADLDTPLSLYVKLANARYTYPARVGRRRRALRTLLVHRPARENPHPRARHARSRSATTPACSSATTAIRSRSCSAFMRRYRVAPGAGLPRFCGGLAGYFGYDTVRHIEPRLAGPRAGRRVGDRRSARHPAAADRRARGRRQPRGQDLPHRLRRSRRAERVCATRATGCRNCGASCGSRWRFRTRPASAVTQARQRIRQRGFPGAPCGRRRSTSPPAT